MNVGKAGHCINFICIDNPASLKGQALLVKAAAGEGSL